MTITIEKNWDGNEGQKEYNGRIYTSHGKWQWYVLVNGTIESAHDRKRDAVARRAELLDTP